MVAPENASFGGFIDVGSQMVFLDVRPAFVGGMAWPSHIAPAPLSWRPLSFAIGAKMFVQEATVRRNKQHEWGWRAAHKVGRCLDSERRPDGVAIYQTAAAEARPSRTYVVVNKTSHVSATFYSPG